MLKVTLYGTPSQDFHKAMEYLKYYLDLSSVTYDITAVSDISVFLEKQLTSIPAIQFDNEPIISLKPNGELLSSIKAKVWEVIKLNQNTSKTMLVLMDFSVNAIAALKFAIALNKTYQGQIEVLHVYKPTLFPDAMGIKSLQDAKIKLDQILAEEKQNLLDHVIHKTYKTGFPGEVVPDYISLTMPSLVVMGNTGSGGAAKRLLGSISTQVLRQTKAPVLFVGKSSIYHSWHEMVYAYDGPPQEGQIRAIYNFAKDLNTKIDFIHIFDKQCEGHITPLIDQLSAKYGPIAYQASECFKKDTIPTSLMSYIKQHNFDILALNNREPQLMEKLLNNGVFYKLKEQVELPMLVL